MTAGESYVLFTVDECRCALSVRQVQEILPFPTLFRPPGTPRVVMGFLNLGGEAIAVVEAAVLFDPASARKPTRERADQHLLLVRADASGASLALAVDRVLDVATIQAFDVAPEAESRLPQEASTLCFWHGGTIVHLMSVDGLLHLEERARLAELSRQAQARLAAWENAE